MDLVVAAVEPVAQDQLEELRAQEEALEDLEDQELHLI
jgi:hypothetical protein